MKSATQAKPDADIQLTHELVNGLTYYTLTSAKSPITVNYVFTDGYLLMAPESQACWQRRFRIERGRKYADQFEYVSRSVAAERADEFFSARLLQRQRGDRANGGSIEADEISDRGAAKGAGGVDRGSRSNVDLCVCGAGSDCSGHARELFWGWASTP